MLRLLLLAITAVCYSNCVHGDDRKPRRFGCVLFEQNANAVQLWALANREDVDVQIFADRQLPISYVHELDLVLSPPPQFKIKQLSIAEISKLGMLATVDLSGTDVSDDEIRVLATLPKIETLILDSTDVTAKSLRHLEKCKSLQILSLHNCNLPDDATASLQHTNPGLVRITGKGHTVISPREN